MNRKIKSYILQYTLYSLIFLFLYLLQTAPGALVVSGYKPLLLLPAAVCVAMHDRELVGGIFGTVGGMLCDMSAMTYFGFNAILFLILGTAVGLLVEYLMQGTLLNALLFTLAALTLVMLCAYFFQYGLWNYEGSQIILWKKMLPTILYSTLWALPFYPLFGRLSRLFAAQREF